MVRGKKRKEKDRGGKERKEKEGERRV